jgi:putative flavoprotein involved in K+ transport
MLAHSYYRCRTGRIIVSKTHITYIAGKPTFHIPDKIFRYAGELYWWFISNILTLRTPIGKKARKSIIGGGAPLNRVSDETGWPKTKRGISLSHKGLYFNGMPFQFGLTSGLVGGVGRDVDRSSITLRAVFYFGHKKDHLATLTHINRL